MAQTLNAKPKPGDLIEIYRGVYQHWAVYIGDGFVVHLAPPPEVPGAGANSVMSVLTDKAEVKREKLQVVVRTDKWKINNYLDEEYRPRPVHDIVAQANGLVGKEQLYRLGSRNCEHFATELRYGKAESRQVLRAGVIVAVTGVVATVGLILVLLRKQLMRLFGCARGEDEEEEDKNTQ